MSSEDEKTLRPLRTDERVLCCPDCGSDRLRLIRRDDGTITAVCNGLDCGDDIAVEDLLAAPRCAGCDGSVMLSVRKPSSSRVSPEWVGVCADCNMVGVLCSVDEVLPEVVFND